MVHKPILCVWEHNGDDTILYSTEFPGAYTRGENLGVAMEKMHNEIQSYTKWASIDGFPDGEVRIIQDVSSTLQIQDADSDVLFESEKGPLDLQEYQRLKALALKSAADFQYLYNSIPDQHYCVAPPRKTFYGSAPRTAAEMYQHTKTVNSYYFGEIEVAADHDGSILECRQRGFASLEKQPGFLTNPVIEGSYGECWSLKKVLRRFIWHDRIHAKAMYRMACRVFGSAQIPDPYCFERRDS